MNNYIPSKINLELTDEDIKYFDKYKMEQLKYIQYKKAIILNLNIIQENIFPEIIKYVDSKLINSFNNFMSKKIKIYKPDLLYIIIANFYNAVFNNQYLKIYRGSTQYTKQVIIDRVISQNLKLCSFINIINIFNWLEKENLVVIKKGFYNRNSKTGQLTRYFPCNDLLFEIESIIKIHNKKIKLKYDQCIEYSDNYILVKKKKINGEIKSKLIFNLLKDCEFPKDLKLNTLYKKKLFLKDLKYEVNYLNEYLDNTNIIVQNPVTKYDKNYIEKYLINYKMAYGLNENIYELKNEGKNYIRVFNDSCFTKGGRLYSAFQQLSSQTRLNTLINNEKIVSVDIKNSHIRLLYHILNIDYDEDAYKIGYNEEDSVDKKNKIRKINKKLFQVILNSKSEKSAIRSGYNIIITEFKKDNINKDILKRFNSFNIVNQWFNKIKDKHNIIEGYFYSGIGINLQYIESCLLIKSMFQLIDNNIPSLCIHDELLIPESKIEITKSIIKNIYENDMKDITKGKNIVLGVKRSI